MTIFKTDDQEEETKQNEEAVKVTTSGILLMLLEMVDVGGKSLDEKNLESIADELINQDIAEINLDELRKVKDFQRYKEVKDVEGVKNGAFRNLNIHQLMKVFYSL